ncbi:MAG TPA: hypothetical protein VFY27_06315 [Woeseiaceae bacterium]|nr:hypothetical protein [Woeseiaceae bacterium]
MHYSVDMTKSLSSHGRRSIALVAAIFVSASVGCGDFVSPLGRTLPPELLLRATAEGVDAGLSIECAVNGHLELEPEVIDDGNHRVQHGSAGGEALRALQRPDGSGVQFWGDYQMATLEVHRIGADSIEIRDVGIYSDVVPSRFWSEFLVFRGHATPNEWSAGIIARGAWTCYPMDTPPSSGEYHDPVGTIVGTWTLSTH